MVRGLFALSLAVFATVTGCMQKSADSIPGKVTSDDVRRDAAKTVNTAAELSQQTKEEFQKNLEVRLNELDDKIANLREKGRDLKDDAKANWDQKMAELESKRDATRAKLAEVGKSSAEAWKDVQKGAQSAWDELDNAFHEMSREF